MAEDRDEIVLLEDRPLDVLSDLLAFGTVIGGEVFLEFIVELGDAEEILRLKAAAFEHRIVPVRPAAADASGVEDDLDPGPFLESALHLFQEHPALHHLELRADADGLQLRDDALSPRIVIWHRRYPVDIEPVREARLRHQLLGLGHVLLPFRPIHAVLDVVVDPVAVDPAHAVAFGLVDRIAIDSQAYRLAHPLVVERVLGILEARELEPPIAG